MRCGRLRSRLPLRRRLEELGVTDEGFGEIGVSHHSMSFLVDATHLDPATGKLVCGEAGTTLEGFHHGCIAHEVLFRDNVLSLVDFGHSSELLQCLPHGRPVYYYTF